MPSHTETQWTDRIFAVREPDEFNALAVELFQWQAKSNPVYRAYLQHLGVAPVSIQHADQIPYLPIAFFKTHEVMLEGFDTALTFRSSGTTGSTPSLHQLHDPLLYQRSFREGFRLAYGTVDQYCLLALLPTYLERQDASLAYMAHHLIRDTGHPDSGFYLDELDRLQATLQRLEATGQPVLLLGVSFALLDLAEQMTFPLRHTVVMETGGMKGRRREMVREELHHVLQQGFGVDRIHSEYGMTELCSQAYSQGDGLFSAPPWMRVTIRDAYDPLSPAPAGRSGGINIIDLANVHSCAFIATQDLGRTHPDGQFEVLGRFDHSDLRGCNLLLET